LLNFVAAVAVALVAQSAALAAETIPVPNGSFELPTTDFADPRIDAWQKTPKPFWYVETEENKWDFLTGVFMNPPADKEGHIVNCDGRQALFLFAVPEVGLFQDYDSTDWTSQPPTHAFDARFEPGKSYRLTVAVMGGGGGMKEDVSLSLGLYYRDAASNQMTVAATNVVFTKARFPNFTNFVDIQVESPVVKANDPWAGQHIGVKLLSTVPLERPDLAGGYWDLDNVRLAAVPAPALTNPAYADGKFRFTLRSEPGLRFEILATSDVNAPVKSWSGLGTVVNETGTVTFVDAEPGAGPRFYQAAQLP
jgi:hypothetical protein